MNLVKFQRNFVPEWFKIPLGIPFSTDHKSADVANENGLVPALAP